MRGYLAKPDLRTLPSAERQVPAHAARTDASARAAAGAEATQAGAAAGKTTSLLQLRRALDQSPKVQSEVALQRALDQRAAAPVKAKKGKPPLQRKGIAINDDAGREREADAMGRTASHAR